MAMAMAMPNAVADGMHDAVRGGPDGLDHPHRGQAVVRVGQDGRSMRVQQPGGGAAQGQAEGEEDELEKGTEEVLN